MNERIIAVAISAFGVIVSLPAPARHSDVLRKLHDFSEIVLGPETQGFITSAGRYVNRMDAAHIAIEAGQVEALRSRNLFSEDLW